MTRLLLLEKNECMRTEIKANKSVSLIEQGILYFCYSNEYFFNTCLALILTKNTVSSSMMINIKQEKEFNMKQEKSISDAQIMKAKNAVPVVRFGRAM